MIERSPITPVMAGNVCIGFVFARGRDGFEAYNDDQSLGLFPDKPAAIAALAQAVRGDFINRIGPAAGKRNAGSERELVPAKGMQNNEQSIAPRCGAQERTLSLP
jgi:hypothetical protein